MSDYSALNPIPQLVEKKEIRATFDTSIHGTAVNATGYEISDRFGINPGEAVRVAKINVLEAFTASANELRISVGTESTDPDDILDNTEKSSLTEHAVIDGIPVPQTAATWIVNDGTSFLPIKVQIYGEDATAGALEVIMEVIKLY